MDAARRDRLKALFDQALSLPPDERAAFLDQACADDPTVRDELSSLLAHHDEAPDFFDRLGEQVIGKLAEEMLPPSRGAPPPLPATVSHYRIEERLGGGGMGIIYKAHDMKLDRTVALKFLPPHLSLDEEAKQRFVHEAKAASALDHPNICTIYEIDKTDEGRLFIAMAYYQGESLKAKIERGSLPLEEALDVAVEMAEGLKKAHEAGIVHRDVKPANVMITEQGRVKLVDFGLAKVRGIDLTKTGMTLGTVAYMSPEQARGEAVDHRTDLWSLGVVLYEMLTGQRPFQGDYQEAVIYAILNEDPEPISALRPEVPRGVEDAVLRLLQKDPAERYQEVDDLLPELKALRGADAQPVSVVPSIPAAAALSMGRWVVIGIPVLLILLGGLWVVLQHGSTSSGPAAPALRTAIAVLPFSVGGDEDLAYLREGMVGLLSRKLDGAGALRGVDPNALLIFVGDVPTGVRDPERGREVAAHFGANWFILGSVTKLGEQIQLSASLYDTDGALQEQAEEVAAHENELLTAIDDLARELIADLVTEPGQAIMGIAAMTTPSLPALKAYLEGEQALRAGRFEEGKETLQRAVEEDSTFALAWSRLADAFWWTASDVSTAFPAARAAREKAMQYSDKLPERTRKMIRAQEAFESGEASEAERLYREVLTAYPEDAAAWFGLGDLLSHYNYLYGRPTSEARTYLERALDLDPDNQEIHRHLIRIFTNEREFNVLDSLLDYLHTMHHSTLLRSWVELSWDAISVLDQGSPEQRDSIMAELEKAAPLAQFEAARYMAASLEDIPAAQRVSKMLTVSTKPEVWQSLGYFRHGMFEVARGRLQAAEADYASATSHEGMTLLMRVLDRMLPFYPVRPPELGALRDEVARWDTTRAPLIILGEDVHAGEYRAIKAYLSGLLSFRLGDDAAVQRSAEQLRHWASSEESHVARALEQTLAALLFWREGQTRRALQALDDAHLHPIVIEAWRSPFKEQNLNRYLRAELLFAEGRYEEALPWYGSLIDVENYWGAAYLGPTYRRSAGIYEHLGETDKAIDFYRRLITLWEDCDPELRPWVDEAEQRLNRLLDDAGHIPEAATSAVGTS